MTLEQFAIAIINRPPTATDPGGNTICGICRKLRDGNAPSFGGEPSATNASAPSVKINGTNMPHTPDCWLVQVQPSWLLYRLPRE